MNVSTSTVIERELGIILPDLYKNILDNAPSEKFDVASINYLITDPQWLIELNNAYKIKPDDLSDIDDGSFFGRIKRFVFHGSKKGRVFGVRLDKWVLKPTGDLARAKIICCEAMR